MKSSKEKILIKKPVTTAYAYFALLGVIAIILGANLALNAPIHGMFFLVWLFIIPVCMNLGYSYKEINESMMESIKNGLGPILLLMAVGAIISTWIASGAVPAIIYYGLNLISPNIFLLATFVLCSMVSLACGTSWGTAGTAGIAMFAVGESLGIPAGMTIGAIISGSFLGDMLSPMSDSTNVAAASVNTDLFTHCKQLSYVVAPAFLLSSGLYYFLGLQFATDSFDDAYLQQIISSLEGIFNLGFAAFIPVIVLIVLLVKKMPAVPAMLISSLAAALVAVTVQGVPADSILNVLWSGYKISTGEVFIDTLLNRGGVTSMFQTAALMLYAFGMIGAFSKVGILNAVINPILKKVNNIIKLSFVSQIIAVLGNLMGTNTFSLLMTGSLVSPAYKDFGLHPTNCSKAINATSTVIAPLIPWNIAGIYIFGLYGISVFEYAPYAFISYITPIVAFLMVVFKIRVVPIEVDLENGEKYKKTKTAV